MRNSYIVILIVTFGRTYMQMLHQCGKVTTQGAVDISVEPQNGPGAWRAGPVLLLFYRNAAKPLSSPFFLYGGGSLRHIRAVFLSVPEETERQPGPAGRKVRAECRPGFRKAQPGKPKGHCLPQLTEVRHVQALFSGIAHDIPQIQIKRLFKIARRRRTDAVLRRKQRMRVNGMHNGRRIFLSLPLARPRGLKPLFLAEVGTKPTAYASFATGALLSSRLITAAFYISPFAGATYLGKPRMQCGLVRKFKCFATIIYACVQFYRIKRLICYSKFKDKKRQQCAERKPRQMKRQIFSLKICLFRYIC